MYLRTNNYVDNVHLQDIQIKFLHTVKYTFFMHCEILSSCTQKTRQFIDKIITKFGKPFFENKWVSNPDSTKIKVKFRELQVKILNIFTLVKS